MSLIVNPYRFAGGTVPPELLSLLHLDGTNGSTTITDETGRVWSAAGTAAISTAQSVAGGASCNMGSAGSIRTADTTGLALGTADFTLEGWLYLNTSGSGIKIVMDMRPDGSEGVYPTIYLGPDHRIYFFHSNDNAIGSAGAFPASSWTHLALCRGGGATRLFVAGTQVGSTYADTQDYLCARLWLGESSRQPGTGYNDAYYDEWRIQKGVALYTANFTPPTPPFPDP